MTIRDRDQVGYAVIGLGMGRAHAKYASQAEGCKLLAVSDIDTTRGKAAADEFHCDAHTDYHEMLKRDDIDVVSVCTPSGTHAGVAIDVARAGKHVLCEKPLDITLQKIDAMIRACRENGVKLGGIFQSRFSPANQKVKQAVDSGRLGRLITANAQVKWYRKQEYYTGRWQGTWAMDGGGSLMNQSIHTVDLFQWIMGPVRSVFAKTGVFAHTIETEDLGVALLTFENGAIGSFIGTTCAYPGLDTTVQVHGENGSIYLADGKIATWKIKGDNEKEEEAEVVAEYGRQSNVSAEAGRPAAVPTDSFLMQIQDMVDSVRYDREPFVSGEKARHAVEIVLAIYESSRTRREVFLGEKPAGAF